MEQIRLKRITSKDYIFLYDLLQKRNKNASISHKKMPTYSQHLKFISSKPYSHWYIILQNHEKIGSIYLTDINEIGLSIIKEKQGQKIEKSALKILMKKHQKKRFLVNVSTKNKKLELFLKNYGFKKIQQTYELIK